MRSPSQTSSGWSPRERAWSRRIPETVGMSPGMVANARGFIEEAPDRAEIGFTGRRSRDGADDRDFTRDFVWRQPVSQILGQRVGIGRGGFAQLHHGDR